MKCLFFGTIIVFFLFLVGTGSAATYPDLMILHANATSDTAPGFPLEISAELINNSTRDAGIVTISAWFSLDQVLTKEDPFLFAYQFPPLSRGKNSSVQMIDIIPRSVVPGTYYLFIKYETKGLVDRNADNNQYMISQVMVHDWEIPDVEEFCIEVAAWIFLLTNEQRKEVNLPELVWNEELYQLADGHAKEMARYRYMDHVNRAGLDATSRAKKQGFETRKEVEVDDKRGVRDGVAENLAFTGTGHVSGSGYINPAIPRAVAENIIKGWMKSPGHRQNILEPAVTDLGVSVRKGGEYYYAAQNFW
jgi:uncharacterized protein YkwD